MPAVGTMRDRVRLDAPGEIKDSFGQRSQTWTTVAEVFAAVEPLSGRELWQAQQVQSDVSDKVTVRYREDADRAAGRWRVVVLTQWNRVLYVESVRAAPGTAGREFLELHCRGEGGAA